MSSLVIFLKALDFMLEIWKGDDVLLSLLMRIIVDLIIVRRDYRIGKKEDGVVLVNRSNYVGSIILWCADAWLIVRLRDTMFQYNIGWSIDRSLKGFCCFLACFSGDVTWVEDCETATGCWLFRLVNRYRASIMQCYLFNHSNSWECSAIMCDFEYCDWWDWSYYLWECK